MVVGDIANESTIRAMVAVALENHGRLDGLVNNAGIFGAFSRFEDNSIEAFDEIVAINVRAAWLAMQYAKPAMLASDGGGSIVNMASMAAMRANRGLSLYGMTKAAIANLTINAATEYAKHDIRVNADLPGPDRHRHARICRGVHRRTPLRPRTSADHAVHPARALRQSPKRSPVPPRSC